MPGRKSSSVAPRKGDVRGWLAALAAIVLTIKGIFTWQDERVNQYEFDLENQCPVAVTAKYAGHYVDQETELIPGQSWHGTFRDGDRLFLRGVFENRAVTQAVFLSDSQTSRGFPLRLEIGLFRVGTNGVGPKALKTYYPISEGEGEPSSNGAPVEFLVGARMGQR